MGQRSGSEVRRREFQVGVRLLPEEHATLTAHHILSGLSPGELLRRAYFGPAEDEEDDDGRGGAADDSADDAAV